MIPNRLSMLLALALAAPAVAQEPVLDPTAIDDFALRDLDRAEANGCIGPSSNAWAMRLTVRALFLAERAMGR